MWGLITFLIGLVYGWASPGRQDKSSLLKTGFLIGVVLALVLALIGYATGAPALGIGGVVGIIISVLVITLLFVLGVWLGDLIEGRKQRRVA